MNDYNDVKKVANKIGLINIDTGIVEYPALDKKENVFQNLNITLVDALNKRIEFLKLVIRELNLQNIIG